LERGKKNPFMFAASKGVTEEGGKVRGGHIMDIRKGGVRPAIQKQKKEKRKSWKKHGKESGLGLVGFWFGEEETNWIRGGKPKCCIPTIMKRASGRSYERGMRRNHKSKVGRARGRERKRGCQKKRKKVGVVLVLV